MDDVDGKKAPFASTQTKQINSFQNSPKLTNTFDLCVCVCQNLRLSLTSSTSNSSSNRSNSKRVEQEQRDINSTTKAITRKTWVNFHPISRTQEDKTKKKSIIIHFNFITTSTTKLTYMYDVQMFAWIMKVHYHLIFLWLFLFSF